MPVLKELTDIAFGKATYDRGIYVDADGYYMITSAPITEASAEYSAVYKTTSYAATQRYANWCKGFLWIQ